jgi:hypothetical protein
LALSWPFDAVLVLSFLLALTWPFGAAVLVSFELVGLGCLVRPWFSIYVDV